MSELINNLEAALSNFILDPANHDVLAIVKGVRNGMVYGSKIRFPHALVMIFLFRSASVRQKLILILKATWQHTIYLGGFVLIYKSFLLILSSTAARETARKSDPFIAGLVAGYCVFARSRNPIKQQMVIYVFARVILASANLLVEPRTPTGGGWDIIGSRRIREHVQACAWPIFSCVSWAGAVWFFKWHPDMMQSSFRSSMQYIYADSEQWNCLRNFLWHNK